jgi:molybdopterin molybdotransferase
MTRTLRPVSAAEARRILADATDVVGREAIDLTDAAGRVLADALVASEDVPTFSRAVMDGFAVRAADVASATESEPAWLSLAGAVTMGWPATRAVGAGEAVAIPTGGHLPAGADAVVMIEHTETRDGRVGVHRPVDTGRNVIHPGDDLRRGDVVVSAGRRLGAADIAALAAFGAARVEVHRRPRVAILSSGRELVPAGTTPAAGQVRDVNQYALAAQARDAGCAVTLGGIVDDDPTVLEQAVQALAALHDVVILSGGSSVGGRDHTPEVFDRLGPPGVLFHGIAVRPGRPTLAARAGSTLLLGIPGVPTSAFVIFEVFVRPVLRRLGGEVAAPSWPVEARLAAAYRSESGREDYLRVRLLARDGETWAEVLPGGASALSNLLGADALLVVPAVAIELAAGTRVAVHPLR